MGHVFARGARWYVRWTDVAGHRRRKATTAKTKREAQALLAELEAQVARKDLGLEAVQVQSRQTLKQLCEWYLNEKCPEPSRDNERQRLKKHIYAHELGDTPLAAVTTDAIAQRLLDVEKTGGLGGRKLKPATVNRLRTTLHAVFSAASLPPVKWHGVNPVTKVPIRKVERFEPVILDPQVVVPVLNQVNDYNRGVVACGLFMGARKGEIFGLLKSDYLPRLGVIRVSRSHQRAVTKGDRIDTLPVPTILKPFLDHAHKTSKSLYLFPNKQGERRSRWSKIHLILRSAVKRSGLVERWEQWCRRCVNKKGKKNVPVVITPKKPLEADCRVCGMKLWVKAVPPNIRFHDSRHTTATNLIRAGVPLPQLQRIIRHANIKTTIDTYGHLVSEDLREAMNAVDHSAQFASGAVNSGPKLASSTAQTTTTKERP